MYKCERRWSRGRLEEVTLCPACGNNNDTSLVFERRDNDDSIPDKWRMVRCEKCKSIWLDPRPDALSLPHAYADYYTHNAETDEAPKNGTSEVVWKLIHGYLNHRFNMHRYPESRWGHALFSLIEPWRLKLDYYGRHLTQSRVGKPGRLLDIGSGNGAFLARAVEMGWQALGCEIDPKAVAVCRGIGIDVIEGDAFHPSLNKQSFDFITMSHVIEHVVDQQALLRRVNKLLRPGGYLWIALPNPESIGIHVFGAAWHALHPPYHLSVPSQAILISWLKEEGFSNISRMRRGAHTRNVWKISKGIAQREALPIPSRNYLFFWRFLTDMLATFSPLWAEETVLLARKPELYHESR